MEAKGKIGQSNSNLYLTHLHVQIHCKRMEAYFSQISLSFFNWLFWHSSATSVNFWISWGKKNKARWLFYRITSKAPFPSPTPHQRVAEVRKICDWCVCVLRVLSRFSRFCLFQTLWTVAHQALLSMGFSRPENKWFAIAFSSKSKIVRQFTIHR